MQAKVGDHFPVFAHHWSESDQLTELSVVNLLSFAMQEIVSKISLFSHRTYLRAGSDNPR
jgi:hypothetical protein